MKVCCVSSLESPHLGDSNEYIQHTIINIKKKSPKIIPNSIKSAAVGFLAHLDKVQEELLYYPRRWRWRWRGHRRQRQC